MRQHQRPGRTFVQKGYFFMRNYNTRDREKAIFAFVMGMIAIIVAVWFAFFVPAEVHTKPDRVYPMVNQRITWEGAGYSGIYGRCAE